ncbi:MAG: metal ABC transporter ATP-binding protein [Hyphomicrobiaceae bacterium]
MAGGNTSRASADAHHGHNHGDASCGHAHHHHHHEPVIVPPEALVVARGLDLQRGKRRILDGVDIHIAPKEIVTLIGPNGAGKTTLVRILLGLEKADSGSIQRRPGLVVGYAPQRFDRDPAIPITVERFLTLGRSASQGEGRAALAEVGASHVFEQQLHALSGGELQRVVLARALVRRPDLLVLDEPVRGVDFVGEAELYGLIGRLRAARGFGVLLVSHDLHVVMAQSDRVICLNRHVCCHGVPETVAQHPEYVQLFGAATARAFGIYTHDHDHAHDLTGAPLPPRSATPGDTRDA